MENAEELKLGMATAEAHLLATFLATLFLGTLVLANNFRATAPTDVPAGFK